MIRKMQQEDLDKVAKIWLDTNKKAHDFIPAEYWQRNYEPVREMLPQAEVYVWEGKGKIQGFVGLYEDYIAGIFVLEQVQSSGIGGQLLDYIKSRKAHLSLKVYQKNIRAVKFYKREGFQIEMESVDQETGEKEYTMEWHS